MISPKTIKALVLILLLSILGNVLWLYEIVQIKGWQSLAWLSGTLFTPYVILGFVVFAFVYPFVLKERLAFKKTIIWVLLVYFVSLICFERAKQLSYILYSRFLFEPRVYLLISALLMLIFFGFALWFTTHILIQPNRKINMLFISLLCVLAIVLSMVTINMFPGFGSQTDWVDAVKMGYPVFWLTFASGVSGMLIARERKNYF